ncbi:MAG: O-phosphoserine--tRNA ligase, partial [Methermicoccaceae archaeon]
TLRSHMTSGWFITLSNLAKQNAIPARLFSVDRCFRREQQEDATRLTTYFSASCVVADEDVSVEDGKAVSTSLLLQMGFTDFKFLPDEKRSKYYVPGTQTEVFAYHPGLVGSDTKYSDGWVEVATFGVYSPIALAQYDIPFPVMNVGLGVERLAMTLHASNDIRKMTYPQFYEPELSDREIASMITLIDAPATIEGREIADAISDVCAQHGMDKSPCEFLAWNGNLFGEKVEVYVTEPEENTRLCGPAAFNEVVVHDGNVFAIPRDVGGPHDEIYRKSTKTTLLLYEAFAARCAREIELSSARGESCEVRVRGVRTPAEVNIRLEPSAQYYITSKRKKIDIRGPVFTTVYSKLL